MLNIPNYRQTLPEVPSHIRVGEGQTILWMASGTDRGQFRLDAADFTSSLEAALAQLEARKLLVTMPARDGGRIVEITVAGRQAMVDLERAANGEFDERDADEDPCCDDCAAATCDECGDMPQVCSCDEAAGSLYDV